MTPTGIQWTDEVWNPVTGCTKVSPGCAHCYAETVALRFWASQYPPVEYQEYDINTCCQVTEIRPRAFTDVQCHEDRLDQPIRWKRPRMIFVNSMSDLFHEDVPDAFIDRVFAAMALAPQHQFQVLTKRAERMRNCMNDPYRKMEVARHIHARVGDEAARAVVAAWKWPLSNVWLGVSAENQHWADLRVPELLRTPTAIKFVSYEPALGPVTFLEWLPSIDWIIVGGESGKRARPFDLQWARDIIEEGDVMGVPIFVKQLGSRPQDTASLYSVPSGKGSDMSTWPNDLRVREFPATVLA